MTRLFAVTLEAVRDMVQLGGPMAICGNGTKVRFGLTVLGGHKSRDD